MDRASGYAAARRLVAVEAVMTPGRWEPRRGHEGFDISPVTDDAGMRAADAAGLALLRNALPAMIRLVEAAETVAGYEEKAVGAGPHALISRALDDLRAALDGLAGRGRGDRR